MASISKMETPAAATTTTTTTTPPNLSKLLDPHSEMCMLLMLTAAAAVVFGFICHAIYSLHQARASHRRAEKAELKQPVPPPGAADTTTPPSARLRPTQPGRPDGYQWVEYGTMKLQALDDCLLGPVGPKNSAEADFEFLEEERGIPYLSLLNSV